MDIRASTAEWGQEAYGAYRAWSGGVSLITGEPIPHWDALPAPIREAWGFAASAVASRILSIQDGQD